MYVLNTERLLSSDATITGDLNTILSQPGNNTSLNALQTFRYTSDVHQNNKLTRVFKTSQSTIDLGKRLLRTIVIPCRLSDSVHKYCP